MKTLTSLGILTFLFLIAPQTIVNAAENDDRTLQEQIAMEDDESGFSFMFAGDPEEEGALKLFVKNTKSHNDLYDPTADSLSQISPAAGIQLHFDF